MDKTKSIGLLNQQIENAEPLKVDKRFSSNFKKWQRNTEVIIEKVFGQESRHLGDFKRIKYSLSAYSDSTPDSLFQQKFVKGIEDAKQILSSMIEEINEFGTDDDKSLGKSDTLSIIENICNRFHLVARQLISRYSNRQTLKIGDEYDVQDLFHSLLRLYFDDIRPEEWTPSYAGGSSRVDFLLKQEQVVVEIKKTRKTLSAKEIGNQLIIDAKRYQSHPNCKCLVCFIYDPEERIGNPSGLENDLTEETNSFKTIAIISPKGR